MKIHMVFKGGLSKLHVCPHRGEGGLKIPKNPSTWFMDVPLVGEIKYIHFCSPKMHRKISSISIDYFFKHKPIIAEE